jgi:hypothetical protein
VAAHFLAFHVEPGAEASGSRTAGVVSAGSVLELAAVMVEELVTGEALRQVFWQFKLNIPTALRSGSSIAPEVMGSKSFLDSAEPYLPKRLLRLLGAITLPFVFVRLIGSVVFID